MKIRAPFHIVDMRPCAGWRWWVLQACQYHSKWAYPYRDIGIIWWAGGTPTWAGKQ